MAGHTSTLFDRIRMQSTPAANPQCIVTLNQARFTVLTGRMFRMEWSETATFEDRATFAFPNRQADAPQFSYTIEGPDLEIRTEHLTLHYIANGQPFDETNLSIEFALDGQLIKWLPGMVNTGNLHGTRRTLDQCADAASLREGLLSRDGWALFDESGTPVWNRDQRWLEERPESHVQDWYFFGYGHDYKATLRDYVRFGGPIPLVPRYVLGLWWSRFWAYHADDLAQLVNEFKEYEIPLDVLVVDMDWHTPDAWTGYTWNRELFPDPAAFLAQMHAQGLFVTLNLHPAQGVQKHEAVYPQFAERMGRDPLPGEAIKFDCTDETFIQNYFELLHHPMEEQGVDFWWVDWQQGDSTTIRNLDPLPWLNHLHFRDSTRRGTRPMLYSRWGGLGNHRYPIGFSGDTYATWESLRFQPYFTATAANVCYGWWSHDIGGHFSATDPELYARWVQFGAVSPCLRLHSTKDPLAERRPWAFPPEVYEAAKRAIQLRYRLFPYLYSAARAAGEQGLSLCCPMYYEYPEAEDAYLASTQYFLGDQLFVAPIVSQSDPATGLAPVDVWIPDGTWTEYSTLETFRGPRWVRLYGDLNAIPMFVKSGGIVPLAPAMMRTKDFTGDHLILTVFPGSSGEFELYEDDGTTDAYRKGEFQTTSIRAATLDDHTLAVAVAPAQGHCPALSSRRRLELHLKAIGKPRAVSVNGAAYAAWHYDDKSRDLVITLENTDRQQSLDILLRTEDALFASRVAGALHTASNGPFVHVVDYPTFELARQQLGTIVVVPDPDDARFDVEVEWTLERGGSVQVFPLTLKGCHTQQIHHSPFRDDGSLISCRWTVKVGVIGPDRSFHHCYQSRTAYPSINHWQALIYNPEAQPGMVDCAILPDNTLNPSLPWQPLTQALTDTLNVSQTFGAVLLEQERHRITGGEPLEACLSTTFVGESSQEVVLYLQHVGDQMCFLNGVKLTPTRPVKHEQLGPMFYTWMPPQASYFRMSIRPGLNQLLVVTHPDAAICWWGIGATVLDGSGRVLMAFNGNQP